LGDKKGVTGPHQARAAELAGAAGPAGATRPAGAAGPVGATGPAGAAGPAPHHSSRPGDYHFHKHTLKG
jgi:hypothetical protein